MANNWQLTGEYLESCSCKGACPCLYLGAPTEGSCSALVAWRIAHGHCDDIVLDGLNVALALHAPGDMTAGNWKVALYLDATADEAQREALIKIFGGQAGGHPALLASFISEVLAVEHAGIDYEVSGGERHIRISGRGAVHAAAIAGADGGSVSIVNHPLSVAPGHPLTVAKAQSMHHQAHGLDFDFSERVAYYSPFSYASA